MLKLVSIEPSTKKDKKYQALFIDNNNKNKLVHFGSAIHEDLTIHKDKDRQKRYISRHKVYLKDDVTKPAYLSMFILWNKPTLQASINDYKQRLKTNNWDL